MNQADTCGSQSLNQRPLHTVYTEGLPGIKNYIAHIFIKRDPDRAVKAFNGDTQRLFDFQDFVPCYLLNAGTYAGDLPGLTNAAGGFGAKPPADKVIVVNCGWYGEVHGFLRWCC